MPIIDDVDVSGCEFYYEDNGIIAPDGTPERTDICTSPEWHCENNESCYENKQCNYKQLQRMKAENAELKNRLMILDEEAVTVQITTEEFEEFKNLKNENAKLKAENEILKSLLDFEVQKKEVLEVENEKLKAECDMYKTFYKAKHDDIKGILFRYKTCLQKIKEIVENTRVYNPMAKQVLKIIKEAEEE